MIESWQELVRHLPLADNKNTQETPSDEDELTWETHEALLSGKWMKTEKDNTYHEERIVHKEETSSIRPTGWFKSYYIGPTDDAILNALPTPLHAADWIAQQHDLEYQELGLNGISGTLKPESTEADQRLIKRCNELIAAYETGIRDYHGFEITQLAYLAAQYMREYFIVEETVTDFFGIKR